MSEAASDVEATTTAVIAAMIGYPWIRFATFVMPLRVHYRGDIVLITNRSSMSADTERLCREQRVIQAPVQAQYSNDAAIVTGRFRQVALLCVQSRYQLCLTCDTRDSFFQGNPFVGMLLPDGSPRNEITLHCESHFMQLGHSIWNRNWMKMCYGEATMVEVYRKCIVSSAVVFGTPTAFALLADEMAKPCTPVGGNETDDFHGKDQAQMNWLYYGGGFASRLHGTGAKLLYDNSSVAVHMRYVPGRLRNRMWHVRNASDVDWPSQLPILWTTVLNYSASGVASNWVTPAIVHQYDVDDNIATYLDDAAFAWQRQRAHQDQRGPVVRVGTKVS